MASKGKTTKAEIVGTQNGHHDVVPYGDDDNEIGHPGCKLCNSKYREEAELLYEKKHNYDLVKRFLDSKGEKLSSNAVSNHIREHYQTSRNIALMKLHALDVGKWIDFQGRGGQETSLIRRMAVLDREFHILSSYSDHLGSQEDRRKNTEQVRKLAETLLSYQTKLEEAREGGQPVQFIFKQLNVLFKEEMKDSSSPEVRKAMVNVLDKLQNEVGELFVGEVE